MNIDSFDKKTKEAIISLVSGLTTKEEINEYVFDEDDKKMKLVKQKIKTNTLPPNTDIIKFLFLKRDSENDFSGYTNEELEMEKQKLLKQLKEKEDDSWKGS